MTMAAGMHIEEKNKKNLMLFGLNLLICVLTLGPFVLNRHFSVDDYYVYYEQRNAGLDVIEQSMRIFVGGLFYFLDTLNINIIVWQTVFGAVLIAAFAWSITRISLEVATAIEKQEDTKKILFVNGGTLILFLNAAISEYLYYANAYMQCILGILGITYGAICIGRKQRILINWLVGVAALTVAAGSYQLFLSQYAYIVMTIILMRNRGKIDKDSIMAVVRAVAAAVIAVVMNALGVNVLIFFGIIGKSSRMEFVWSGISEQIRDIIRYQRSIWIEGMGIYPTGVLAVILLVLMGVLIAVLYKRKAKTQEVVFTGIALISGLCVMYVAQIMQGFIRVTNRGMYAVFGIYAVAIWIACYYLGDMEWKRLKQAVIWATSVFLLYSNIKINGIAIDVMKTNTVSRCYIEEISRRIDNYENQSGMQVTKVGFCSDASISYRYYSFIETAAYGDMCANPFLVDWSNVTALKYYSGRNLEAVNVPDHIVEFYATQDWTEADWEKQLFFNNDEVYICVY